VLKSGRQQGHSQRQRIPPASKAVAPDALRLANLANARQHLRNKGERDRRHDTGLREKSGRRAHQLRRIHREVERCKDKEQRPERIARGGARQHSLQCDRAANQWPFLWQRKEHNLALMVH